MQMIKFVSFVLACIFLSGCAYLDSPKVKKQGKVVVATSLPPEPKVSSHMVCDTQNQEGCLEIVVGNYRYDPGHPVLRRLEPRISESNLVERKWRLQAGPTLWQESSRGGVRAAIARSFVICAYALREPARRSLSAYQFDGKSQPRRWDVADISNETWRCPIVNGIGVERIYRIAAFGNDPRAASIQFPWSTIGNTTHILVCSEDGQNIYPNPLSAKDRGGLWLYPEQLQWLRDERKSRRVHLAVVSPQ